MVSLLRRRALMIPREPEWDLMIHNSFNTYYQNIETDGNTFVVKDGGEWVEIVSNGMNKNKTQFILTPYYVYNDIKDKRCKFVWNIECDSAEVTSDNSGFNISIGTYTSSQAATSGNPVTNFRKTKQDIISLGLGNVFRYGELELVPSDVLGDGSGGSYFTWNIGCRSSLEGIKFRILQLDFAVHK